jgi:hypothetical protein
MHKGGKILIGLILWASWGAVAEEETFLDRIDRSTKQGMEAINAGNSGKKTKADPSVESQYSGQTFNGGGNFAQGAKSGEMAPFLYDQKVSSGQYETTRSFFGIKNPWIGRQVFELKEAPLMARGELRNDKSFASDEVETRAVPGTDRPAFSEKGDVKTRTYLNKGKAEGKVTQFGDQLNRDMSIEEVREILNKNR